MRLTRWLATLATVLSICGSAAVARADESQSAYRLSFDLDASLLLLSGGVASSFLFMNETGPPACAPLCDRANVNAIDRHFAGYYSESWTRFGDITTASVILLIPAGLVIGEWSRAGFKDLVVVAEALLMTSAIQVTTSYAVNRPRPRVYGEEAPLDERNDANAGRSFFSGHTANVLAGWDHAPGGHEPLPRPARALAGGAALAQLGRVQAGEEAPLLGRRRRRVDQHEVGQPGG